MSYRVERMYEGGYQPRWGDLVHYGDEHAARDELPQPGGSSRPTTPRCSTKRSGARRTRRLAATARPGTMCEIANRVDGLLCSSKRRVRKAEDPDAFFGEWLARKGLGFADAVLVDDREDNRAAFEAHGGSTIAWSPDAAVQAAALDAIRAFAQPADTLAATPA